MKEKQYVYIVRANLPFGGFDIHSAWGSEAQALEVKEALSIVKSIYYYDVERVEIKGAIECRLVDDNEQSKIERISNSLQSYQNCYEAHELNYKVIQHAIELTRNIINEDK